MKTLIRRELQGEVVSNLGEKILSYVMFGIISIILMWLLGPRVTSFLDVDAMNEFVTIVALLITYAGISNKLENDDNNRQMTFLQTLPVRKGHIVHAKFLNMLLVWGLTFVWISVVVSVNLFINGNWTLESWSHVWGFLSALLFIQTMVLFYYFWKGYRVVHVIFYLSAAVWGVIFIPLGLTLESTGLSNSQLWGLSLLISFILYFVCWRISVQIVNTKGLLDEIGSDYAKDEDA